jgi:L-lysine exporter family protein LysE/ArgO
MSDMETSAFLHGFVMSFGLIMPLGAQNIFIFTQGAAHPRFRAVLPVVLVAGLCDTLLILLAVLGISVVLLTVAWVKIVMVIVGICFLLYIGWTSWRAVSEAETAVMERSKYSLKQQIAFTVSVSLLNPHAILDTIAIIGTASLAYSGRAKVAFSLACIFVSWLWFFMLAGAGRCLGTLYPIRRIQIVVNKISAVLIWICAIYLGVKFLG